MKENKHIPLPDLCTHYKVEMSFFTELRNYGLIEVISIEQTECLHEQHISNLEKIIRLHQELHINFEGIDTVFNMLDKIENLKLELAKVKNRLRRYEEL